MKEPIWRILFSISHTMNTIQLMLKFAHHTQNTHTSSTSSNSLRGNHSTAHRDTRFYPTLIRQQWTRSNEIKMFLRRHCYRRRRCTPTGFNVMRDARYICASDCVVSNLRGCLNRINYKNKTTKSSWCEPRADGWVDNESSYAPPHTRYTHVRT